MLGNKIRLKTANSIKITGPDSQGHEWFLQSYNLMSIPVAIRLLPSLDDPLKGRPRPPVLFQAPNNPAGWADKQSNYVTSELMPTLSLTCPLARTTSPHVLSRGYSLLSLYSMRSVATVLVCNVCTIITIPISMIRVMFFQAILYEKG